MKWRRRPIRELCSQIVDCVNKTAPTVAGPTPWRMIRTTNVRNGRISLDGTKYVEKPVYDRWVRRGVPAEGDIILTREAPLGEVAKLREASGIFLGQRLVMYRPDPGVVDADFLLAAMQAPSLQAQMRALGSGSTVEHLRVGDCEELLVDCPPLPHQRRIGAFLASFDDLIDINERRVGHLEMLIRMAASSWVAESAEGNPTLLRVGDRSGRDMWSMGRVSDLGELCADGVDPADFDPADPYIGLEHLPRRSTTLTAWGSTESVKSRKLRFHPGDTLFGKIRPNLHKVAWAPFAGLTSSDTMVFRASRSKSAPAFLAATLASDRLVAEAVVTANGTKMPRADPEVLMNFPVRIPGDAVLTEIEGILRGWFDWSAALAAQNAGLRTTRDFLLPRVVTGRLDISNVDLGILTPTESE